MPVWVLLVPLAGLPVMIGLVGLALTSPGALLAILGSDHGLLPVMLYLLIFGPSYLCAFAYWLRGRVGFGRAILLAHAFELYSNLWLIAGWIALFRVLFRRRGWAKTARVVETEAAVG